MDEARGLQHICSQTIKACKNMELQEELFKNIALVGGGALLPGFSERLKV